MAAVTMSVYCSTGITTVLQRGRRSMAAVTDAGCVKCEAERMTLQRGRRSMAAVTTAIP